MAAAPGKRSRAVPCLIAGCLVLLIAALVVVGAFAALFFGGRSQFGPVAEAFFAAYNAEQYDTLYGMTSETWRNAQSREEIVAFLESVHEIMGPVEQQSFQSVNINASTEHGTHAQVGYGVTFATAPGSVDFTFVKEQDAWRVQGVNFDSPALEGYAVCPDCGGLSRGGQACPRCHPDDAPGGAPRHAEPGESLYI
jgi:hypothetical protein